MQFPSDSLKNQNTKYHSRKKLIDLGKIIIKVPADLRQAIAEADPGKPYDICLNCDFLQKSCDDPNMLAMDYPRWVEWANSHAKQLRLTRAQIAEQSNLPKSTLDSILSGRTQDIRASTMRSITKVLVGGCWGQYPCHIAAMLIEDEGIRVDDQILALQNQLSAEREKSARLAQELETARSEGRLKADFLRAQDETIKEQKGSIRRKEKTIALLCAIVALLMSIMIGALIYDKTHPDVGWIRQEATSYDLH